MISFESLPLNCLLLAFHSVFPERLSLHYRLQSLRFIPACTRTKLQSKSYALRPERRSLVACCTPLGYLKVSIYSFPAATMTWENLSWWSRSGQELIRPFWVAQQRPALVRIYFSWVWWDRFEKVHRELWVETLTIQNISSKFRKRGVDAN